MVKKWQFLYLYIYNYSSEYSEDHAKIRFKKTAKKPQSPMFCKRYTIFEFKGCVLEFWKLFRYSTIWVSKLSKQIC